MVGGNAVAEADEPVDRRRRTPLLGIVAGVLLVVAAGGLWLRLADPFNPYRPGSSHQATIQNSERCANTWTVKLDSGSRHYWFANGGSRPDNRSVPKEWDPNGVNGTLHILHNWSPSGTDAVFEADGQEIHLSGGSDDQKHFFGEGCAVL